MRSRYAAVVAGAWEIPPLSGFKVRCCDCGLVHRLDFRVIRILRRGVRGKIGHAKILAGANVAVRMFRDERATAASRRKRPRTSGRQTR